MPRLLLATLLVVAVACGSGSATTTVGAPATEPAATATTTTSPSTTSSTIEPTTTTVAVTTSTVASATTGPPAGPVIEIVVEGGEVRTELRQEVPLGAMVTLAITADVADEVHLHTYDVITDTVVGETVFLEFEATIPGIFEVELENAHLQILELVVQ